MLWMYRILDRKNVSFSQTRIKPSLLQATLAPQSMSLILMGKKRYLNSSYFFYFTAQEKLYIEPKNASYR